MADPVPAGVDPLTEAIAEQYRRRGGVYKAPSTATAAGGIVPARASQSTSTPGLPAPYVQREPETRKGPGGQTELLTWDPQTAKEAYTLAPKVPNAGQTKLEAVRAYNPDPYLPESTGEIAEATDPSRMGLVLKGVEVLGNWLQPFDFPRRYAWQGVEELGRVLPEPTDDLRYKDVGLESGKRIARDVAKANTLGEVVDIAKHQIGDQAANLAGKAMAAYLKGDTTNAPELAVRTALSDDALMEQVGQNLYRALSTGRLAEQSRSHRGSAGVLQGVMGDTVNPIGRDIVDAALPKELAYDLADRAWQEGDQASAVKWHILTTEVGREGLGLALEVAADPMWMLGPAKGAQTITKGEKAYTVAAPVVAAVQAATDLLRTQRPVVEQAMLDLLLGTGDADRAKKLLQVAVDVGEDAAALRRTQAKRMLSEATDPTRAIAEVQAELRAQEAEVRAAIDAYGSSPQAATRLKVAQAKLAELSAEAQKLGGNGKDAAKFLRNTAAMRLTEATAWDRRVRDIRRVMEAEKGLVVEEGRLALSAPGDVKTRYLLRKGAAGDAVASRAPRLVRAAEAVADLAKPYTKEGLENKVRRIVQAGIDPLEQLSRGEKLALGAHSLAGSVMAIPAIGWDILARTVGTRWIQPAIAYTQATRDMAAYGRSGLLHYKVPFWGTEVLRLKRVHPEVWDKYQTAVGKYLTELGHLESKLVNHVSRMVREAERVWKSRRAQAGDMKRLALERWQIAQANGSRAEQLAARAELDRAELWGGSTYTPQMVLDEAADLIERGAGLLQERPELQGFATMVQELVSDVAAGTGRSRDEVAQALVAMERAGAGDPLRYEAVLGRLRVTRDAVRSTAQSANQMLEAARELGRVQAQRHRALRDFVDTVQADRLAPLLNEVQASLGGVPWGQEQSDYIRRLVVAITGDESAARAALAKAADALGAASGEEAVRLLAEMVAGATKANGRRPGGIVADSIRRMLADLEEVDALLTKTAFGPVTDKEEELVGRILGERFRYHRARAKLGVGGDDWPAFQAWFGGGADLRALVRDDADVERLLARVKGDASDFLHWYAARFHSDDPILVRAMAKRGGAETKDWEALARELDAIRSPSAERLRYWSASSDEMARAHAVLSAVEDLGATKVAERGRAGMGELGGYLNQKGLLNERLLSSVRDAKSQAEAELRLRSALGRILPAGSGGDPYLSEMADTLAQRLAADFWRRMRAEEAIGREGVVNVAGTSQRAVAAAREVAHRDITGMAKADAKAVASWKDAIIEATEANMAGFRQDAARLSAEAKEVRPRFEPPKDGPSSPTWARDLETWERDLWADFRQKTEHLDADDRILVAFAALRDMPNVLPSQDAHYRVLAENYPELLGRRLNDLPEDMRYLVGDVKGLIASYERLYEQHGRDFMADLSRRARDWGVVGYVPHMVTDATKLKMSKVAEAMEYGGAPLAKLADANAIDQRLSTGMDAAKRRAISGTIAEINALKNDPALSMTFDPQMLIARYFQSNRAMTAQDFMLALMQGGVIRTVRRQVNPDGTIIPSFLVAQAEDMVPLFGRRNSNRDMDLIVLGTRDDWAKAGVEPAELSRMRDDLRSADPFARWVTEAPELKAARGVEEALLAIRQTEWDLIQRRMPEAPAELFNPIEEFKRLIAAPGKSAEEAWSEVAAIMKDRAARAGVAMPLEGKDLATYYAQGSEVWQLYVPHAVAINMREVLDTYKPDSEVGGLVKAAIDKVNSFWKTRLTVMRLAFSTRNALSNQMTNILDLGPTAAMSPSTQALAAQLTYAAAHRERWGSLETALQRLSEGRRQGESLNDFAARKLDLAAFKAPAAFGRPLEDLIRYGVDLGDGVARPIDDALELLSANGVVTQGLGYADITRLEAELSSMMVHGGLDGAWDKVERWASTAEDVVLATMAAAVSGGVPIALPKEVGGNLARVTETQARMVNFIGNMKQTGNVEQAAAHTQKFLFNYDDLTGVQRVWMRTLIPFFTWTQKNIALQADMAQRAPYFYATFNRLLIEGLPRLVQADDADYLGQGFAPESGLWPDELRLRQRHTLGQVRIPLPARMTGGVTGQSLEGLGLPQEAAAEQLGMMGELLDFPRWASSMAMHTDEKPYLRLVSQSAFMAKMAFEWAAQQHVYYDRPLRELTNGSLIAQHIAGLRRIPLVGSELAAAMEHATGLAVTQGYNQRSGEYDPDIVVNPGANWLYANLPWSAVIRDASAATDVYHLSLATNSALAKSMGGTSASEVPPFLRYLDAMTGIRVAQQDDAMRRKVVDYEQEKVLDSILESRGHVRDFERTTIEER